MSSLKFNCRKDISPRTKYAIRKLGIDVGLVLEKQLDNFEGTGNEKKIKYDFYNETKEELLKQIAAEREKDEFHLNKHAKDDTEKMALIQKEKEKFEATCKRQNKELQRMCNEQTCILSARKRILDKERQEEEQRKNRLKEESRKRAENEELQRQHNSSIKKAIKRAENQLYEKSMKTIQKSAEIQKRLDKEVQRQKKIQEELKRKRIQMAQQRIVDQENQTEKIEIKKGKKRDNIQNRYDNELNCHGSIVRHKAKYFKSKTQKRQQDHAKRMENLERQRDQEKQRIIQKSQESEKRCNEFKERQRQMLAQKKAQSCNNMEKVKQMALEEEERRKKSVVENQKKADASRKEFFKKRAEEQKLANLKTNLKKNRVLENVKRCQRQKNFKKIQLLKKQEEDDERRKENIKLQMMLKQQRLLNNYESKVRLETYKQNFENAVQSGVMSKLGKIKEKIENQMHVGNVGMSVPKGKVVESGKAIISSSEQITRLKEAKIKSQLK